MLAENETVCAVYTASKICSLQIVRFPGLVRRKLLATLFPIRGGGGKPSFWMSATVFYQFLVNTRSHVLDWDNDFY